MIATDRTHVPSMFHEVLKSRRRHVCSNVNQREQAPFIPLSISLLDISSRS